VHAVASEDVADVDAMIARATETALREGFARLGDDIVVVAGLPFGRAGTTNLLHVARIAGG
jgi:pyruvate kinase